MWHKMKQLDDDYVEAPIFGGGSFVAALICLWLGVLAAIFVWGERLIDFLIELAPV